MSPEISPIEKFIARAQSFLYQVRKLDFTIPFRVLDTVTNNPTSTFGPRGANIDIVDRCDSNCSFCLLHSPYLKQSPVQNKDTDIATFKKIIDGLKKARGIRHVTILGDGEPLLNGDFGAMIEYLISSKIRYSLVTNGILLDAEKTDLLLKGKAERVVISIHATTNEVYNAIHCGFDDGAFEKVCGNVYNLSEKIRAKGLKTQVATNFVVCRENAHQLENAMDFFQETGIKRVNFKPLGGPKEILERFELSAEEYSSILECLIQAQKKSRISSNAASFIHWAKGRSSARKIANEKAAVQNENSQDIKADFHCFIPWDRTVIRTSGDVLACSYATAKAQGNIHDSSFEKIWQDETYGEFRSGIHCPQNCQGMAVYPFVREFSKVAGLFRRNIISKSKSK